METVRKNLHLPDAIIRLIGDVLHSARFRSETQAVIAMLEGAADRLADADGYVYLARGAAGLKIGTSLDPAKRAKSLKAELLHCISGDRLSELAVHMIWGRYRLSGEWFEDRDEIVTWFAEHDLLVPPGDVVDGRFPFRAVVNLTPEQYDAIKAAADKLGLSVPGYCRVAALEKANKQ